MLCLHHLPLAVNEGNMLSTLITQAKCLRRQPSYATAVAKSEAVSSVGLPANATAQAIGGSSGCKMLGALAGAQASAHVSQGSGRSEGHWVSLGAHEVEDVAVLVAHIRETFPSSMIAIWGRSMGAVTALLYSQRDPSIAGVVRLFPHSPVFTEIATKSRQTVAVSSDTGSDCRS